MELTQEALNIDVEADGIVSSEHALEFLLTKNHSEEADNTVPKSVSNLVVHIVDSHVHHIEGIVTKLGIELDAVELELDKDGCVVKWLDDRRFQKMHLMILNLQRLLQVTAHGEQVFSRVKEKYSSKPWFNIEDYWALEELIERLEDRRVYVGCLANRVTEIQADLVMWQAKQINRKLYFLSLLSIIFFPFSVLTRVFGMNAGVQRDPMLVGDSFRNIVLLHVAFMLLGVLVCFVIQDLYTLIAYWRRKRAISRTPGGHSSAEP